MTTSGSTDWTLNARQVITYALRKLMVVDAQQPVAASDMAVGMEELNALLKWLQMVAPNLWRQTEGSIALVNATASYSFAAAHEVVSARFRQNGRDIPMTLLTREEYYDLPLKTSAGIPTQYYFDRQRAGGTLYVWPVLAAVTSETIQLTYLRRHEDIDALENSLDIPNEYLSLVGYLLAERLCADFGVRPDVEARVTRLGREQLAIAQANDREPVMRIVPALGGY